MSSKISYDNNEDNKVLNETLHRLLKNVENEIVEFKAAKNDFSFDKLGRYVSAISNEANLREKRYGWLIFGVDDKTHNILGTNYKNSATALEKLKLDVSQNTTAGLTFMDIYVLYPDNKDKRVLMFQIPAAAISIPTGWKNRYYDRKGESLSELSFEKLDRIRGERKIDWSKRVIANSSIDDLDIDAIKVARSNYEQVLGNSNNPQAAEEYKKLSDEDFLKKMRLIQDGKVTNAAMVLLGRSDSEILFEFPPQIMWRLRNTNGKFLDSQIFRIPFILAVDEVYKNIRNLK